MQEEIWKDVKNYEKYYRVSNIGKIKSLSRISNYTRNRLGKDEYVSRRIKGKILKLNTYSKTEYKYIILHKNKINQSFLIHRLVLETFVDKCPTGMEACHNNGIRTDNRIENLRWDTHENNLKDTIKHGRRPIMKGNNHYNAKLNEKDIKKINLLLMARTYKQIELAEMFNVTPGEISHIKHKRTWGWLNNY